MMGVDAAGALESGRRQAAELFGSGADAAGTALKYTLVALLDARDGELRDRIRRGEISRAEIMRAADALFTELLPAAHAQFTDRLPQHPVFRRRVIDLAVDAFFSEPLSPELRLAPAPVRLPVLPVHALVFSAFPHVTHELFPLMVDACVADPGLHGERTFQVVGVHEEWLEGQSFRRALLFDEEDQGLIEADVTDPPAITVAQALALNLREEADSHTRIARALAGVPFINPAAGARRLDDKAAVMACWRQAGLLTPDYLVFAPGVATAAVAAALSDFAAAHGPRIVNKPVDGTEGRGVEILDARCILDDAGLHNVLAQGLQEGRIVLSAEHGLVRYAALNGPVRCTVRLNLCCDGETVTAESGYAQVARDPDGIASAGRGGRMVPLTELLGRLCLPDGTPFPLPAGGWDCLLRTAEAGARALAALLGAEMPALIGLDLLLDPTPGGGLSPVLLEANPRPAGMSHCRLLTAGGPTDEPGVSLRLWQVAERRRAE